MGLMAAAFLFAFSLLARQSESLRMTHEPPPDVCGDWLVKTLLPTSNVQASPASLKRYVGTKAVYTSAAMKFGRLTVQHPLYSQRRLSDQNFFEENYILLAEIGVKKNGIVDVEVWDSAGRGVTRPGTELFIKSRTQLVTTWDGGYFELVRTGPCPQHVKTP